MGDDLKIRRANYDGSGLEVIASPGSPYAAYDSGIAADHASGSVFWSETATDRIYRSDLDGSNRRVIVAGGLHNPGAMVVVNNPEPSAGCVFVSLLAGGATMRRRR